MRSRSRRAAAISQWRRHLDMSSAHFKCVQFTTPTFRKEQLLLLLFTSQEMLANNTISFVILSILLSLSNITKKTFYFTK